MDKEERLFEGEEQQLVENIRNPIGFAWNWIWCFEIPGVKEAASVSQYSIDIYCSEWANLPHKLSAATSHAAAIYQLGGRSVCDYTERPVQHSTHRYILFRVSQPSSTNAVPHRTTSLNIPSQTQRFVDSHSSLRPTDLVDGQLYTALRRFSLLMISSFLKFMNFELFYFYSNLICNSPFLTFWHDISITIRFLR